jgi:hypothetical protein
LSVPGENIRDPGHYSTLTDLERSNAELRAAVRLVGKRIRKLQFGRRNDDPVLVKLREVLRDARRVAEEQKA